MPHSSSATPDSATMERMRRTKEGDTRGASTSIVATFTAKRRPVKAEKTVHVHVYVHVHDRPAALCAFRGRGRRRGRGRPLSGEQEPHEGLCLPLERRH